jgi:hypothetical protein
MFEKFLKIWLQFLALFFGLVFVIAMFLSAIILVMNHFGLLAGLLCVVLFISALFSFAFVWMELI